MISQNKQIIKIFPDKTRSVDWAFLEYNMAVTEADTCRQYVLPKLYAAGWDDDHIREQHTVTAGRIMVVGRRASRNDGKRLDYLLRYKRDFLLAVVEAKSVCSTDFHNGYCGKAKCSMQ
jgi:type I site-specific restriction endonuclease